MAGPLGSLLPELRTPVPGPRSRELSRRLQRVESRNVTAFTEAGPLFWSEAAGANVRDVDGNVYVDLTSGFGVATTGHRNPVVVRAVERQAHGLVHAMGDVHPADVKVELLEALARVAPGDLSVSILSANGSDATESALKTARLATGRPGVVAFEGAYHGLGYGALAVTHGSHFRDPFRDQLFRGVRFAPFPGPTEDPGAVTTARVLEAVARFLEEGDVPVGAVIVEPIQGRAGIQVPPDDFLPGLRELCSSHDVLLILDEIYTGLGRTGRWFACQHQGVVPDLILVGKALAGGLPLSAVVGRPSVMEAWPPSGGEAIHTSTFLGNPIACAAAAAQLHEIQARGLVERAATLGRRLAAALETLASEGRVRGMGLMLALPLGSPERAAEVAVAAQRHGVLILPEGDALAFTPPLTISEAQLDHAVGVVARALDES